MNDDDLQLKSYQDDLTTDDTPDPFMNEEGEDPSEELGVPANELKDELDKKASGIDDEIIDDDEREYIEDLDEDGADRN